MNRQPRGPLPIAGQDGMALIAALFMIIVVAGLGAFALRIGANQQQTANLELLTYRTEAAAMSGLEYLSYMARTADCVGVPAAINVGNVSVTLTCTGPTSHIVDASGVPRKYFQLDARAVSGVYGNPDFVQRSARRRVSNVGGTPAW